MTNFVLFIVFKIANLKFSIGCTEEVCLGRETRAGRATWPRGTTRPKRNWPAGAAGQEDWEAERGGFEPPVQFPGHSISSAAQSAALSPLPGIQHCWPPAIRFGWRSDQIDHGLLIRDFMIAAALSRMGPSQTRLFGGC